MILSVENRMSSSAALACAVCIFLFCISGTAQISTPTLTISPTPDDTMPVAPTFTGTPRPLPSMERVGVQPDNQWSLSLQDAVELALKNNNDIDASRNDVRISDFGLMGARGVFDPLLSSEHYYESLTTPTASAIGGAVNGAVTQNRLYSSAGLSGFSPFAGGN